LPKKRKKSLARVQDEQFAQAAYVSICFAIAIKLIKRHTKAVTAAQKAHARRLQKKFAVSPLARALAVGTGFYDINLRPPSGGLKLHPLSALAGQSGDPSRSTPLGSPSALLQSIAKTDNKKDK